MLKQRPAVDSGNAGRSTCDIDDSVGRAAERHQQLSQGVAVAQQTNPPHYTSWFDVGRRGGPGDTARVRQGESSSENHRPDDCRPGRLPLMLSTGGNVIWSCRVYAQPANVRLVLRAGADGHVWACIGTSERDEQPRGRTKRDRG